MTQYKRGDILIFERITKTGIHARWFVKVVAFAGRGKKKLWGRYFGGSLYSPGRLMKIKPTRYRQATEAEIAGFVFKRLKGSYAYYYGLSLPIEPLPVLGVYGRL